MGFISVVLVFAYSNFVRTLAWLAYRYLVTLMLVKTPIYDRIYLTLDWRSTSLTRKVEDKIREMKLLVKKDKHKRIRQEIKEKRDKEQKQADKQKGSKERENGSSGEANETLIPNGRASAATPGTAPASTTSRKLRKVRIQWAMDNPQPDGSRIASSNRDLELGNSSQHPGWPFLQLASIPEGDHTSPSLPQDAA